VENLEGDKRFAGWLSDESMEKLTVDAKASLAALARLGMETDGIVFDLLLAAYIANPSVSLTDASSAAREFGFTGISEDQAIYGKGAKRAVPAREAVAEHASRKALGVYRLRSTVEERLREN